jgi:hypothetical protein
MIFHAGDPNDLARCIDFMKANDADVSSFGKGAYDSYWKNPSSMDNYVSNLIGCYSETLSRELSG